MKGWPYGSSIQPPRSDVHTTAIPAANCESFRSMNLYLAWQSDEAMRVWKEGSPVDDKSARHAGCESTRVRIANRPDQAEHRFGRFSPVDPSVLGSSFGAIGSVAMILLDPRRVAGTREFYRLRQHAHQGACLLEIECAGRFIRLHNNWLLQQDRTRINTIVKPEQGRGRRRLAEQDGPRDDRAAPQARQGSGVKADVTEPRDRPESCAANL